MNTWVIAFVFLLIILIFAGIYALAFCVAVYALGAPIGLFGREHVAFGWVLLFVGTIPAAMVYLNANWLGWIITYMIFGGIFSVIYEMDQRGEL